jgi:4-hydroxy-3-polyprenylbenzoate decarboxylase
LFYTHEISQWISQRLTKAKIEYLYLSPYISGMAYAGIAGFIDELAKRDELRRIKDYVNPELEITEITDRISKSGGKALLFENTGTDFPLLINAYGSGKRMALAIGRTDLDDAAREIDELFERFSAPGGSIFNKISSLPSLVRLAGFMPSKSRKRGTCQQVVQKDPDLGILPVLKCWPHDGGRFITLPVVHTIHPDTGKINAGMYRMQILDRNTTAMHWQRHKTGAAHFEAWKKKGERMPVSVSLGGDPVYAYSATAPLPDGIDEFILAGFLRKKRVKMVPCITNNLYVPSDADIILEGYVDPAEEPVWEGPFGDHTGFYSLADWYPKFHVTCITHSRKAVYPATIVGVPPQEDAWLAKATEKIFLSPVKMALQPEIEDFHMPDAGVAHNLVIIKINKSYPGQGMKVISSLSGAGQMMFSKYMVVVSGNIDIRNYMELVPHIFDNTDPGKDLLFSHGPLDVLDHSSDTFSFGGKMGIDATIKHTEERGGRENMIASLNPSDNLKKNVLAGNSLIDDFNTGLFKNNIPVAIISVNRVKDADAVEKVKEFMRANDQEGYFRLILVVDHTVDVHNLHMVAWQILGNSDPERDHEYICPFSLMIDGTIKAFRKGGFPRRWPNVVCSGIETISAIDTKWDSLGLGPLIKSPSETYRSLVLSGDDEILIKEP